MGIAWNLGLEETLKGETKMPAIYTTERKKEISKKAFNTLILSLGDKVLQEVSRMKTAAEIWPKLEGLYMTKSLSSRLYLKALVLLHSLPKSYETFVDILKHGRDTLSLDDVIGALNSKELHRRQELSRRCTCHQDKVRQERPEREE